MAQVNLGRIGFVNKGSWNSVINYKLNDVVKYNNSTYAAKRPNVGVTPPTNGSETEDWFYFIDGDIYATLNGNETQKFKVADAVESNEAISKSQFDASAVKLTGSQTINGVKTFSSSIDGNITGNAASATRLQIPRAINGVAFDGSANITVRDDSAVKLTGIQTISGVKTFEDGIITPEITVDSITTDIITATEFIATEISGDKTIKGETVFVKNPVVPDPITNFHVVTKQYVDRTVADIPSLPIGTMLTGYTVLNNCIVAFGGEFLRAAYPNLWAYLQANPALLKTEATWVAETTANGGICGFFSDGDGSTTFRAPNLDKAFLRLDSRGAGSYQIDMFKQHSHSTRTLYNYGYSEGSGGARDGGTTPTGNTGGEETRPKNIAILPLIVAK